MNTIGSLKALKSGITTGFVGYPQRYEIGPEPGSSFIYGVDQAGDHFKLELRVPKHFIEAAKKRTDMSIPDVASLAETHRKARNPCYASPDNGSTVMTGGCFLAEQASVVDEKNNHYAANWLSVLRENFDSPVQKIGYGYLEFNSYLPNTAEAEEKKLRLMEMNEAFKAATKDNKEPAEIMGMEPLVFADERDHLTHDLYQLQTQWFIGVEVQYHNIVEFDLSNEAAGKKEIIDMISRNSVSGMYGGVILRPIKEEGGQQIVVVDSVRRLNHQFDYKKREIPTVESVWDEFIKNGGSGWLKAMKKNGYTVEIIPCQRVNCGKVSNEKYSKDLRSTFSNEPGAAVSKQLKAFVDTKFHQAPYVNFAVQHAHLACPIAMRNAETRRTEFNNNILLSSVHSFGKAIGNALELDRNGERTLKLSQTIEPVVKSKNKPQGTTLEP